jgi:hypothetical protein
MSKLSKLLKSYELNSDMQYFDMILESIVNGHKQQAVDQFKELPKADRKNFLMLLYRDFYSGYYKPSEEMVKRFLDVI